MPFGKIGAKMPAAPQNGVPLALYVERRPVSDSPDRSGPELFNGSNGMLWHLALSPFGQAAHICSR
jgi:hypothetical protein